MKRLLFLLLTFPFASLLITGCNTSATKEGYELAESGETSMRVSVPAAVEEDAVRQAVINSLIARGWTVDREDSNRISAELNHREITARLDIAYNGESVVLDSDSYDEEGKAFVPVRWMEYLQRDIERHLALASSN